MESTPSTSLYTTLVDVMKSVTTSTTTTITPSMNESSFHTTNHLNETINGNITDLHMNITRPLSEEDSLDFPTWVSIRLFLILSVLVGIVLLACGSYTLHNRYFKRRKAKYYKPTLLLS